MDRAEAATERVVDTIDRELRTQIAELRRDIERLVARVGDIAKRAPAKKAPAKKPAATKGPAKKSPAKKKPAAKKSSAKKAAAAKSPAKKKSPVSNSGRRSTG